MNREVVNVGWNGGKMSAGICIMNHNAIALAADSAVTIGEGVAIHNSVNKLFSLSRVEPVGAIIYSNASFMRTPVEIILKQYRKYIDEGQRYFERLEDYVKDFMNFLIEKKEFLRLDINEKNFVLRNVDDLMDGLDGNIKGLYQKTVKAKQGELTDEERNALYETAITQTEQFVNSFPNNATFKKEEYIEKMYGQDILKYLKQRYDMFSKEQVERLWKASIQVICKEFYRSGYVGIAFAGYGKKEIYPTMVHIHLAGILEDSVKYQVKEKVSISETRRESIVPLAQVDVMETFLYGVNNAFIRYIADIIPETLDEDIEKVDDKYFVGNSKNDVKKELKDSSRHIVKKIIKKAQDDFLSPIKNAVMGLPMDELGMLAESMVNLTSLRRNVAIDSYSRTVGGPIDVAIISKGDGFIWTKRKHYFSGELNPQYFSQNFGGSIINENE